MKEKILALLEQKKYPEIAALVKDMNPADAAVLLEELPQQSMQMCIRDSIRERMIYVHG